MFSLVRGRVRRDERELVQTVQPGPDILGGAIATVNMLAEAVGTAARVLRMIVTVARWLTRWLFG